MAPSPRRRTVFVVFRDGIDRWDFSLLAPGRNVTARRGFLYLKVFSITRDRAISLARVGRETLHPSRPFTAQPTESPVTPNRLKRASRGHLLAT